LRLKILKKLRTASFNSEFTGSYKKKCSRWRLNSAIFRSFLLFFGHFFSVGLSWKRLNSAIVRLFSVRCPPHVKIFLPTFFGRLGPLYSEDHVRTEKMLSILLRHNAPSLLRAY